MTSSLSSPSLAYSLCLVLTVSDQLVLLSFVKKGIKTLKFQFTIHQTVTNFLNMFILSVTIYRRGSLAQIILEIDF